MVKTKRVKLIIILTAIAIIILTIIIVSVWWVQTKIRHVREVATMLSKPGNLDANDILSKIDENYLRMSKEEQAQILNDPAKVESYVADAAKQEMQKSFSLILKLPGPIRRKIYQETAAKLRRQNERKSPEELRAFLESPAGRGAVKGMSRFFMTELNGRQKAEVSPMADEIIIILKKAKKHD